MLLLHLLQLFWLPYIANADLLSSSTELGAVFSLERKMVELLREYENKLYKTLSKIRLYLMEYEHLEDEIMKTEERYLEKVTNNPLHTYHLVKRLTVNWKSIQEEMKKNQQKELLDRLDHLRSSFTFPEEKDLHGAAYALIRLQDIYNLNVSDLSRGTVWDLHTKAELKAQDCTFMGKHCYNAGIYTRAIEWFEEAHVLAGLEANRSVSQEQVAHFLDNAIRRHNLKLDEGEKHLHLYKEPLRTDLPSDQRRYRFQERPFRLGINISKEDDIINFAALCRGEKLLDDKYVAKLKCWVDNRNDPFYLLKPVKVEQHYLTPAIYSYHDVVSSEEIERLISLARPLLSRSRVVAYSNAPNQHTDLRTSKTSWLKSDMDPLVKKLERRVSWITGLKADSSKNEAELLQIANYASGGYYNLHFDFTLRYKKKLKNLDNKEYYIGDRIATFMFYLTDVIKGGATVFPRIGLTVWPRNGSALFWHNLKASGQPDILTLHGACPVVYGNKWVANKWIREAGQLLSRPCKLDANK